MKCLIQIIVLVLLLVFGYSKGNQNLLKRSNARIVNGVETTIEKHPYMVMINIDHSFCGGTLVSDKHILTAAHCVGTNIQNATVIAGTTYFYNGDGQIRYVIRSIMPQNYRIGRNEFDIALLKVHSPFILGTKVQLVRYPKREPIGKVTVVGWGATSEGGSISNRLMETELYIISRSSCNDVYKSVYIINSMICAYNPYRQTDACQGDSGGPLMSSDLQVGIVSFGIGCARPNTPGVYTNVAYYADWITKNIGVL